jgi:hypothetical protein
VTPGRSFAGRVVLADHPSARAPRRRPKGTSRPLEAAPSGSLHFSVFTAAASASTVSSGLAPAQPLCCLSADPGARDAASTRSSAISACHDAPPSSWCPYTGISPESTRRSRRPSLLGSRLPGMQGVAAPRSADCVLRPLRAKRWRAGKVWINCGPLPAGAKRPQPS